MEVYPSYRLVLVYTTSMIKDYGTNIKLITEIYAEVAVISKAAVKI